MLANLGWIAFAVCMVIAALYLIAWSATFPADAPADDQQPDNVLSITREAPQQEPRRAA